MTCSERNYEFTRSPNLMNCIFSRMKGGKSNY
ncbi:conserved hypothetical protein, partial [Trichinella spiralis]